MSLLLPALDLDHDIDSETISNDGSMLFFPILILNLLGKLLGVELLELPSFARKPSADARSFVRCYWGCAGERE